MSTSTTITTVSNPISGANNVLHLVPEVDTHLTETHRTNQPHDDLEGYDEEQIRLMDEVCIVIDENDAPIGSASKKVCHLMDNINKGLLHRAFSVFLFDASNRLLLQQRAPEKITFPGVPGETGAGLDAAVNGVRRAAQRKLYHELGIKASQVPVNDFHFLTRIHYKASSDVKWGEHEIDYILFIKADVDLEVNKNEVQDVKYIQLEEMKAMLEDNALKFTPWFKLICQSMLFEWWEHLDDGLDKFKNEKCIRRML